MSLRLRLKGSPTTPNKLDLPDSYPSFIRRTIAQMCYPCTIVLGPAAVQAKVQSPCLTTFVSHFSAIFVGCFHSPSKRDCLAAHVVSVHAVCISCSADRSIWLRAMSALLCCSLVCDFALLCTLCASHDRR